MARQLTFPEVGQVTRIGACAVRHALESETSER